jgi:hypothetical protein
MLDFFWMGLGLAMICLAALPNSWPTAILAWYPSPALFYPLPLFFTPSPNPLPQVEGGTHTPPLAGESERASDPVGGGVAAILSAPLHDAVLFFRIAPCNTSSYPPPILT